MELRPYSRPQTTHAARNRTTPLHTEFFFSSPWQMLLSIYKVWTVANPQGSESKILEDATFSTLPWLGNRCCILYGAKGGSKSPDSSVIASRWMGQCSGRFPGGSSGSKVVWCPPTHGILVRDRDLQHLHGSGFLSWPGGDAIPPQQSDRHFLEKEKQSTQLETLDTELSKKGMGCLIWTCNVSAFKVSLNLLYSDFQALLQ